MTSLFDNSIEPELETTSSVLFDPEMEAATPDNKRSLNRLIAMETINKVTEGEEIDSAYQNISGLDSTDLLFKSAERVSEANKKALESFMNVAPDVAIENADVLPEAVAQLESDAQAISAPEEAFTLSILPSMEDDEVRERVKNKLTMSRVMGELTEDVGFWDYAGLFLTDLSIDINRVTDGGLLSTGQDFKNFVFNFRSMPLDDQQRLFPQIVEELQEATDQNELKTNLFLLKMIDPEGEEDVKGELAMDKFFLALDAAGLGTLAAKPIVKLIRSSMGNSVLKSISAAGDTEMAGRLNALGLTDSEVADVLDTAPDILANNHTPWKFEGLHPQADDAISAEVNKVGQQIDTVTKSLLNREDEIAEGFLSASEKDAFVANLNKDINDKLAVLETKPEVTKLEVLGESKTGLTVRYEYLNPTDNVPVRVKEKVNWTLDDISNTYKTSEVGIIKGQLASPSYIFASDQNLLVNPATRILMTSDKHRSTLTGLLKDSLKPLGFGVTPKSKKSLKELDAVLLYGDDYLNTDGSFGKVFSIQELRAGMETPFGYVPPLNDKQVAAYYNVRKIMDMSYILKNDEVRTTLSLRGLKEVDFQGKPVIGKVFDDSTSASRQVQKNTDVYDPAINDGLGGVDNIMDSQLIQEAYDEGWKLARLDEAQKVSTEVGASSYVRYAWVQSNDVSDLPQIVLHRKAGYVPKASKDGFYFVKQNIVGKMDGKEAIVNQKTMRMFDNKSDAEKFKQSLNEKNPDIQYEVLYDREMDELNLARESYGVHGGLYTGSRASEPVRMGLDDVIPDRVPAMESIQRNLDNLARHMPLTEWRLAAQKRWLNTARQAGPNGTSVIPAEYNNDFFNAINNIGLAKGSKERRALEQSHEYIVQQMRIPSAQERATQTVMRDIAEYTEGINKSFAKTLHRLDHRDPVAMAKASAFHALLGFYNPAQLIVQAFGSTIALSIDPLGFPRTINRVMALHTLDLIPNEATQLATLKKLSKMPDLEDIEEIHSLWKKSGYKESIFATGDLAAVSQGMPMGMQQFKTVLDNGLVFYKEGELYNRRYAFTSAYKNWKKANPSSKLDDAAGKTILDEANQLMLNLTRANRATWQEGFTGIPTQFWQIATKYTEALVPGSLMTPDKRFKLMIGQAALFGAAGIPMGEYFLDRGASLANLEPGDMDEKVATWMRGGTPDLMAKYVFGSDVNIGSRGAIAQQFADTIMEMFTEKASLLELLSGAFGSLGIRAYDAAESFYTFGRTGWVERRPPTQEEMLYMMDEAGDIISTWRNGSKAAFLYFYPDKPLLSKNGAIMLDQTNPDEKLNAPTLMGHALGFSLNDLNETYKIEEIMKRENEVLEDAATTVFKLMQSAFIDQTRDPKISSRMADAFTAHLDPAQKEKVFKMVANRIKNGKSRQEKLMNSMVQKMAEDLLPVDVTTVPSGAEQFSGDK